MADAWRQSIPYQGWYLQGGLKRQVDTGEADLQFDLGDGGAVAALVAGSEGEVGDEVVVF